MFLVCNQLLFFYLDFPLFQLFPIFAVSVFRCSCFPAIQCSCFQMFLFSDFSCFQMFLFSDVPVFRCSYFLVFLFLCSCCLNAEARRSRLCWLVLKRFHCGVISGRRPGIVWFKATFRYTLTIWDRTETPGIPKLVPLRQIGEKR